MSEQDPGVGGVHSASEEHRRPTGAAHCPNKAAGEVGSRRSNLHFPPMHLCPAGHVPWPVPVHVSGEACMTSSVRDVTASVLHVSNVGSSTLVTKSSQCIVSPSLACSIGMHEEQAAAAVHPLASGGEPAGEHV